MPLQKGKQTKLNAHSDILKPQKKETHGQTCSTTKGRRTEELPSFPLKTYGAWRQCHTVQIKKSKQSSPPILLNPHFQVKTVCESSGVPLHPPYFKWPAENPHSSSQHGQNEAGRHKLKAQVLFPSLVRSDLVERLHADLFLGNVVQQLDLHGTAHVTVVNLRAHQRLLFQALRFAFEAVLL